MQEFAVSRAQRRHDVDDAPLVMEGRDDEEGKTPTAAAVVHVLDGIGSPPSSASTFARTAASTISTMACRGCHVRSSSSPKSVVAGCMFT
jgi:hypothetical protein